MIIVKKPGHLIFKNFKFRCSLGKNGISDKKEEGDGITPRGTFKLTKLFYREDKIKNIRTEIKKVKIKKNMGWCDDPKSKFYNKLVKLPSKFSHEKFYRKDNIYNIVVVLDYNLNPIIWQKKVLKNFRLKGTTLYYLIICHFQNQLFSNRIQFVVDIPKRR